MKPSCVSCRFFSEWTENGGYCHRRAPVNESSAIRSIGMLLQDIHWKMYDGKKTDFSENTCFESEQSTCWPYVTKEDWCGEFEPREPA